MDVVMDEKTRRAIRRLGRRYGTVEAARQAIERVLGRVWADLSPAEKRIVRFEFWRG